jgi:hypothetical protein
VWRSRTTAVAVAFAAALASLPAQPAASAAACAPGLGIGLVEFPAGNRDPRAQNYVIDHVAPGARFSRRFQVCNGTTAPVTVQLYAAAAAVTDGAFELADGRTQNELSGWVSVAPAQLTVAPGQRALARATFTVPAQAESGERYAVLLAELPPAPDAQGVAVSRRVGIRVYLDVGPGGAPRTDFVVDSLQASRTLDGKGQVTAQVHNTGARALDITGSLTLRDGPGGLSGGPYAARLGSTLAPGETHPVVVPIDNAVADGPWTAQLVLRSGLLERRVEAPLTFPDAPGADGPPVDVEQLTPTSSQQIDFVPLLSVAALLLLAVGAFGLLRRRRRTSPQ